MYMRPSGESLRVSVRTDLVVTTCTWHMKPVTSYQCRCRRSLFRNFPVRLRYAPAATKVPKIEGEACSSEWRKSMAIGYRNGSVLLFYDTEMKVASYK